jgi:tetratricopeptide (TPR) repeat protein
MLQHVARDRVVRMAGLACVTAYAALLGWLYVQQPGTMAEVAGGVAASVGLYGIDRPNFEEGIAFFRNDQFPEARAAFERADAARRDPTTQFYIAYSHYREGWGRLYHDRRSFERGLEAVDRAIAASADGRVRVGDPELDMQSADELRAELQRGLRRDVNPLRVLRNRK